MEHAEDPTAGAAAPRADAFLSAALEARGGGRGLRAVRLIGAIVAQVALGLLPSPALHDVVVRRRSDGEEVLRVTSGDPLQAGDMLAHVRTRLAELDEEAFLAEWRPRTPAG